MEFNISIYSPAGKKKTAVHSPAHDAYLILAPCPKSIRHQRVGLQGVSTDTATPTNSIMAD
jgi:hypothetical protein